MSMRALCFLGLRLGSVSSSMRFVREWWHGGWMGLCGGGTCLDDADGFGFVGAYGVDGFGLEVGGHSLAIVYIV